MRFPVKLLPVVPFALLYNGPTLGLDWQLGPVWRVFWLDVYSLTNSTMSICEVD